MNTPHTQIGWRLGRIKDYRQTREWSYDGKEIKTTDWTDHDRPSVHPYPHDHNPTLNPTGGTLRKGDITPFRGPDE